MDPRRLIRNMSILIASSMFLLVLTSGLPMLPVTAHGVRDSRVQATASPPAPIDPTVTALQKAQLAQQLDKLQRECSPLHGIEDKQTLDAIAVEQRQRRG